jgi:hypothetical protein
VTVAVVAVTEEFDTAVLAMRTQDLADESLIGTPAFRSDRITPSTGSSDPKRAACRMSSPLASHSRSTDRPSSQVLEAPAVRDLIIACIPERPQ